MPMIVPHQSQAGIATGNAGQAAPYRGASAFMTPGQSALPNGLQQLAHGMDKLGDALAKYGLDRMRMQNATDLLADKIAYEDALRDFDSNYRQTHQGVSARDAEEAYGQFHKEQYDKLQKKWGGNPFLMQGVDQMAASIRQPSMQRAVAYRDQQEDMHRKGLLSSSEARTLELFADPSRSMEEKEAALHDHENSLMMIAGQQSVMVDGKIRWQGGRNIDAELMALRQRLYGAHLDGLIAAGDLDGAQHSLRMFVGAGGGRVGDRVAVYESRGAGVNAVGYDRNGGTSYGKYQLSSKQGSYDEWLNYLGKQGAEGAAIAGRLKVAGNFNTDSRSGEAVDAYRKEAEANPELFERTQREYIEKAHYGPMLAKLSAELRQQIAANPGLQEMAWSTAVQHGGTGGARILSRAWKKGMSDGELVDAVYDARGGRFGSSTPEVQASVRNRFGRERAQIHGMLGGGALPPGKAMDYQNILDKGFAQRQQDAALQDFAANPQKGIAFLSTPEGRAHYGMDGKQAVETSNLLNTHWTHLKAMEKQQREDHETRVFTNAVNLALGVGGQNADPVEAYRMIAEDETLDGQSKLRTLKAIREGTLDQDDPGYVVEVKRRIANNQPVTDAELAQAMATGRLSHATKDTLLKMRDLADGPQGAVVKAAFNAIDAAYKKSMMADGTPEQALAHYSALRELQDLIEEAKERGRVMEFLDPNSPKYILPAILQRHQLSMSDQVTALKNKVSGSGGTAGRNGGESIDEYLKRRSGGHQ